RDGSLAPYPRLDHEQTGLGPGYRIYPAADGWVAVVAPEKGELDALLAVAGVGEAAELDRALAPMALDEVLARLEAAGVAAEGVRLQHMHTFFDDPANRTARPVVGAEHAPVGAIDPP